MSRQAVLEFAEPIPERLPERFAAFIEFHKSNPQVYRLFVHYALEAHLSGRQKLGARSIWERMRWHLTVEVMGDEDFAMNDHHVPYYARLAMARHPELDGFFETRDANFDTTTEDLVRKADELDGARGR